MREKIPQPNQRARLYYRGRFGERGKDHFNWMVTHHGDLCIDHPNNIPYNPPS